MSNPFRSTFDTQRKYASSFITSDHFAQDMCEVHDTLETAWIIVRSALNQENPDTRLVMEAFMALERRLKARK